jgi:hypothetical protein
MQFAVFSPAFFFQGEDMNGTHPLGPVSVKGQSGKQAGPGPGPQPVPSHPIPPVDDPRVTEPRPEPITELPDKPPAQEPPELPPAPRRLI